LLKEDNPTYKKEKEKEIFFKINTKNRNDVKEDFSNVESELSDLENPTDKVPQFAKVESNKNASIHHNEEIRIVENPILTISNKVEPANIRANAYLDQSPIKKEKEDLVIPSPIKQENLNASTHTHKQSSISKSDDNNIKSNPNQNLSPIKNTSVIAFSSEEDNKEFYDETIERMKILMVIT
jgi:hypothetical protein